MFRSTRNRVVRSAFFSFSHEPLRNSTATFQPSSRSTASSIRARFSFEGKTHFGYWSRIEPSWPRSARGARPVAEHPPDLVVELGRQVLGVDPALRLLLLRQRLADRLREALRLRALAGHQRVGLDVEREVRWRPVHPELGGALGGQGVVGRVDLDDRERRRVVLETRLCVVRPDRDRRRPKRSSSGPSTRRCRRGSGRCRRARSARRRPTRELGDAVRRGGGAWIVVGHHAASLPSHVNLTRSVINWSTIRECAPPGSSMSCSCSRPAAG